MTNTAKLARKDAWNIFIISFAALFVEILLIRWIPGNIRVMAYFANAVLISCFLGMGVGCLVTDRFQWIKSSYPLVFSVLVVLAMTFENSSQSGPLAKILAVASGALFLYLGIKGWARGGLTRLLTGVAGLTVAGLGITVVVKGMGAGDIATILRDGFMAWGVGSKLALAIVLVPVIFFLIFILFVAVGQHLGEGFEGRPPLPAYFWNLVGSLAGIVGFTVVSVTECSPVIWVLIAGIASLHFARSSKIALGVSVACYALCLAVVASFNSGAIWSPYYKIALSEPDPAKAGSFELKVNDDYHQLGLNLTDPWDEDDSMRASWRFLYDFPHQHGTTGRALVVGAGSGNDVMAALRSGATHVDAVEIDRSIYNIGVRLHPEKPYEDERVSVHINDARNFIRNAEPSSYDTIVYGFLDSHTVISSMSSVRLDNYVYTRECFEETKRLLKPDGRLIISFLTGRDWVGKKIHGMMTEVFGHEPLALLRKQGGYSNAATVFVISQNPEKDKAFDADEWIPMTYGDEIVVDLPEDDWPHLYVRSRSLANHYVLFVICVMAFAGLVTWGALSGQASFQPRFFFLGAGFLLLETKSITSLAILFGATWIVNSFVIGSVMLAIVLSTVLALKIDFSKKIQQLFVLLVVSIIANYTLPTHSLLGLSDTAKVLAIAALVGLPIFMAGLVFSTLFKQADNLPGALGSNLVGAVLGGLSEYASLLIGYRGLSLLALGLYLLAWYFSRRQIRLAGT